MIPGRFTGYTSPQDKDKYGNDQAYTKFLHTPRPTFGTVFQHSICLKDPTQLHPKSLHFYAFRFDTLRPKLHSKTIS